MGEHIATVDKKDSESGVKQAKRWLKSQYTDYDLHFFTYLSPLLTILSATGELILVIDGSETGKNVLVYSLAWFMVSVPFLFVGLQEKAKKGIFHRKCT